MALRWHADTLLKTAQLNAGLSKASLAIENLDAAIGHFQELYKALPNQARLNDLRQALRQGVGNVSGWHGEGADGAKLWQNELNQAGPR